MRNQNPIRDDDRASTQERIKAALDSYVPEPVSDLPRPAPAPRLECRWVPVPVVSKAHIEAGKRQREYDAQQAAQSGERADRAERRQERSDERAAERASRRG